MSNRIAKINKHLQRTVGEILLKEADLSPDVLVTISRVETAPNLRFSDIWLYVIPQEKADETLESLKTQMYDIQGSLNRSLEFRPLPRIRFRYDAGGEHADTINKKLDEIKTESGI
ncbi:MAG TPA: ribosome-binding factor A [Candidatus Andersenbacteria bacterium]|nr:ribosome-binding factor A [Candidatus Andersenbacteria bacterium]